MNNKISETLNSTVNTESAGPSEFGRWLRDMRLKHNLSTTELAEKTGVTFKHIYNIENGTTQHPRRQTHDKLTKVLSGRSICETGSMCHF